MKMASVDQMKAHFSAYLKASKQGPVIVTRNGKPIAALVPVDDEELERLAMAHSPKLQAILEAARQRFRSGAGIPHDVFWKQVEAESAKPRGKRGGARKNGRTKR